jgi:hypothetical protein
MNAPNQSAARSAARHFADRFGECYPHAVTCLRNDLDDLLTCVFATNPRTSAATYETLTRSNDVSAKSGDGLRPWAPSRTKPAWIASCSPSSLMKTSHSA